MRGRVVCIAGASTLLLLGAGCSSNDDDAVPIETLTAGATAATPSVRGSVASATTTPATTTTILDLDTYAYGSEYDWAREIRASEILIAGCMEEHGLDYVMSQPVDAQSLATHNAALLAPLTLEEVQTFGYAYSAHRIAGANGVEAASVTDQTNPVSMDEYVGATGCGEQTAARLGTINRNIVLGEFATAAASIRQRADSDPRVVETLDAWSACMAVSGYDVRYPEDAIGLAESMEGGVESQPAIDVAVADFSCNNESGYRDARDLARSELSAQWLEQHPGAVARLQHARAHLNAQVALVIGT